MNYEVWIKSASEDTWLNSTQEFDRVEVAVECGLHLVGLSPAVESWAVVPSGHEQWWSLSTEEIKKVAVRSSLNPDPSPRTARAE